MLGELGPVGQLPQALVVAAAVLVCLAVVLIAGLRGRGRATPAARTLAAGAARDLDLASVREQVVSLREQLVAAHRKAEANERLLLAIPECTKQLVNVGLEDEQIPNVVARQLKSLLDPALVAVFRYDPERQLLDLVGGAGVPSVLRPPQGGVPALSLRLGTGRVGLAAEHRTLVDDAKYRYERQRVAEDPASSALAVDLAAPVEFGDELLGVIAIRGSRQSPDFQRWLLMMVAELTAVAIHTARTRVRVEAQATTDGLTGLHNRKYLTTRLAEELRRAESYSAPFSVILFDVDNFKHYNDRNGHPAGDVCLKTVARVAKEVTRSSHVVVRYGGEEFLVLAPDTTLEQAMAEAERIRATIAAADIEHAAAQPLGCVSVSIGVATFPAHGRTGDALVQAADTALYRSKQAGRNRVSAAADGFLSEVEAPVNGALHG